MLHHEDLNINPKASNGQSPLLRGDFLARS